MVATCWLVLFAATAVGAFRAAPVTEPGRSFGRALLISAKVAGQFDFVQQCVSRGRPARSAVRESAACFELPVGSNRLGGGLAGDRGPFTHLPVGYQAVYDVRVTSGKFSRHLRRVAGEKQRRAIDR